MLARRWPWAMVVLNGLATSVAAGDDATRIDVTASTTAASATPAATEIRSRRRTPWLPWPTVATGSCSTAAPAAIAGVAEGARYSWRRDHQPTAMRAATTAVFTRRSRP